MKWECLVRYNVHITSFWWIKGQVMHRLSCLFDLSKWMLIYLWINVDLFTLALEKLNVNTPAWKKWGGLIYILFLHIYFKSTSNPSIFYAHEVSTYTDVKDRLTGDSCATPRCDEVGWARNQPSLGSSLSEGSAEEPWYCSLWFQHYRQSWGEKNK